jgi:hypothetical protein
LLLPRLPGGPIRRLLSFLFRAKHLADFRLVACDAVAFCRRRRRNGKMIDGGGR